ncbi:hypothetical protein HD554DRAFT_2025754, partial [Boletus coccyginus]
LVATHYLQRVVHFRPLPRPIHIPSRRSPALTNGHGLAREHDQPWTDALPIADQLIALLRTAWDIQNNRRPEDLGPRDPLVTLGKKYDQYLDFRQQDAHEFLCRLLGAIRMEESDVSLCPRSIRLSSRGHHSSSSSDRRHERIPPSGRSTSPPHLPKTSRYRLSTIRLDVLFGGKLASILVCQACKHVSHTCEDFSDLSLSINANGDTTS